MPYSLNDPKVDFNNRHFNEWKNGAEICEFIEQYIPQGLRNILQNLLR